MDNEQLDQYIDDVIEDLTIEQLTHVVWYISTRLEDATRNKYPDTFISEQEQATNE